MLIVLGNRTRGLQSPVVSTFVSKLVALAPRVHIDLALIQTLGSLQTSAYYELL